ncbi:malate:quinone oxidoreductase [Nesterenkonia alkaliphila]|uniref:Probable malate:quinone oxidoreductase n=1 Tax=Nesterenkonia alkaliphila TaxID=1463631 RepID=A0A7K1UJJ2_9MICC|nr:malate:quinone oxidoreductase [Nesterenkonia alkaliphila]MVT26653.1 FAD-dependent oxidoreductase [Nesterenkonia alkaliphila]GFZ78031.1 putative malate:quinone oxidoreductase [Nesterenkonia alkaliphila]
MGGRRRTADNVEEADIVLIGGGIMSATLGAMITLLQPDWRIVLLERSNSLATESSDPWNNAGTGHSGFSELNYMPDPTDGSKPAEIARQFHITRQWWAHLVESGLLDPSEFIHTSPHMDVVFDRRGVDYLRQRYQTLITDPFFAGLEYSEDPARIANWAPLIMEGRVDDGPIAATRHVHGTDVDFGALTRALTSIITDRGGKVLLGHDVSSLGQQPGGRWLVSGRSAPRGRFTIQGRHVFVGAGGFALRLLQRARLPEVRGYGVLPVGAAFYRCSTPEVAVRHDAKVYGQAAIGAPPMSVPHLDKRIVEGQSHLLFGPYATFSTKLLKHGKLTDFFTTLRWHNLHVITAAGLQNLSLVRYLIKELAASPKKKFAQLQRFYPSAAFEQWELILAGQRAQLVTPDKKNIGVLRQGTEVVTNADHSISGLLGASPGASTAVPIMLNLLRECFTDRWQRTWKSTIATAVPGFERTTWDADDVSASFERTASALDLTSRPDRLG